MSAGAIRGAAERAGIAVDDMPDYPAPLVHRGPDTVAVFDADGYRYAIDDANVDEGWISYEGPIVEVLR